MTLGSLLIRPFSPASAFLYPAMAAQGWAYALAAAAAQERPVLAVRAGPGGAAS